MRCPTLKDLPPSLEGKVGWPWTEQSERLPDKMPNGRPWPCISIVTPSYNQGQFIEETIRSVLLQGYPNIEYIVIDGGSTDNSVEIIKKYESWITYWVSEPDRGQSHAINKGFSHATGDLLGWLNSDDHFMPGALKKFAEVTVQNPEAGAFVGIGQIIDPSGKVIYYKEPHLEITVESLYNWLYGYDFMQPSCLFTKFAWQQNGPLGEDIHIALDLDLWLKVAKNFKFVKIPELLSTSRSHGNAKTIAYRYFMIVDTAIVVMRHGGEFIARKYLENLARKLSWYECNFRKIRNNPMFKLFKPITRIFTRPLVKWEDTIPEWLKTEKKDPSLINKPFGK